MLKYRKLLLAAAAIATVTAAAAVTGITAASAAPVTGQAASGTEYVQIMSASATGPSGPASAIARGVFTAAGQARLGDARDGTIAFPGGTIVLSHRPGKTSAHFYPAGCLSVISQSGSYRIVRGTGRYAGISGHGTYQLSLEMVAARARGACSSAKPPVAQQELLRLSGPARL